MADSTPSFTYAPVEPDRWDDLVELFERPGPRGGTPMPGSCWCMWWRERSGSARTNKAAMKAIVGNGDVPGVLAYEDGVPVGWVSVAPREGYGQLTRSRTYRPVDDDAGVFVITCFYVDPRFKHRGVGQGLLHAAIESARARRATAVEVYPNDRPDFMGARAGYDEAGFVEVRRAGKRTVMRLALS